MSLAEAPSDNWQLGDPYERYVGRWSRLVAPRFLEWLRMPAGRRWLDVGCGTGALSAAIADRCAPSFVAGVEPSDGFRDTARMHLPQRISLHTGNASSIPFRDSTFDVVASGLVLNFVPDVRAALDEMVRVATQSATVAAYVWDYAEKMELMRYFWNAAVELDPSARASDEGVRFAIFRPEALTHVFVSAGLRDVDVTGIEVPTRFASFDDYWTPFLGGQGPAPAYAMSLDEAARNRLRDRLRERLPAAADGSIALIARAWAVRGAIAR